MAAKKPRAAAAIEVRKISDLKRYPNNARYHSPEQVKQIAESIKTFGFNVPVLIDAKDGVIAGHGRLDAAELLAMKEVPAIKIVHLTEAEKRAFILADNKIALNSEWLPDKLKAEIEALQEIKFELAPLGFNQPELNAILKPGYIVRNAQGEWSGMPDYNSEDKGAFRSIVVHFRDQAAVDDFVSKTGHKMLEKTRTLWHPEIEIETYVDKVYDDAEENGSQS